VQTISLAAGDAGNRVEFANSIDWRGKAENLKATFPLTASNPEATYNEEVGVIKRPNATERQFEVLSHRWIDLTDKSGSYGVTILTDAKNASDKPGDNTIRLTLLRTPGISTAGAGYSDQANQDWGHHEITFGLCGPCRWLARRSDGLAGLPAEQSSACLSYIGSPRRAWKAVLAAARRQPTGARARSQEGGGQRRDGASHGGA